LRYYILLTVSTLVISTLAVLIVRKTRQIGFIFGILCLYFWSLFGAWTVVTEKLYGGEMVSFAYLYYKMFPVYLDDDYFLGLVIYSLFAIIVEIVVLWLAESPPAVEVLPPRVMIVSHWRILAMGSICGLLAYLIVRHSISVAATENFSAYGVVRKDSTVAPLFGLHQILNRAALAPLFLGISIWLSGRKAKFIGGSRSVLVFFLYLVALGGMFVLNFLLGNRSILVFMFVLMTLFYLSNTLRPSKLLLAGLTGMGGITLIAVKLYRDGVLSGHGPSDGILKLLGVAKREIFTSTESFAAHFSMYGTLAHNVKLTFGESFLYIISSFVPRAIWENKPETSYDRYASGVGLIEGQGYTIHHATGWYINFGIVGVIAGAILLGLVWVWLHNCMAHQSRFRGHLTRLFVVLGFANITAFMPTLLRAGPEAYRSLALEGLLIPLVVLAIATTSLVKLANRPTLAPTQVRRRRPSRAEHAAANYRFSNIPG